MLKKLKKAINRAYRVVRYQTKIYGKLGQKNSFASPSFVHENSELGNYNYVGPYTMINHAIIGNYCSIAPGVKVGQGDHSIDFITTYNVISSKVINHSLINNPAIIGNDVWLGANVVVKQGVTIGNGAVVGANAVVTKDVPPFAIAVGVPAKIVKFRFSEQDIKKIEYSGWFLKDLGQAINSVSKLSDDLLKSN